MFDISWGHMVVVAVVALVVIGPKELPTVLRTVGQWVTRIRRMASEFQGQFQEALREAEMADLKQHFDDISTAAKDIPRFDPIGTVRREIEGAVSKPATASAEPAAASPAPSSEPAQAPASTTAPDAPTSSAAAVASAVASAHAAATPSAVTDAPRREGSEAVAEGSAP